MTSRNPSVTRWLLLTIAVVLLAGCVPLLFVPRYYFLGDTQVGAYGQWFHLGQKLRAGEWPMIDLSAWHGGNYIAEGQWGLFSPLTMAIALLTTVAPNAVVFVTALKFALLSAGATGVFLLARSYRVTPPVCFLVGVAATLGGTTQYLDSPEWVTGQMIWALVPLTWWAIRRTILHDANPALALVLGLLTVTVGYVYGTLYLIIVLIACLVDAALLRERADLPTPRRRTALLRVLGIGICCGLVTVSVYLPGIGSVGVTTRAGVGILWGGRLNVDLQGLFSSMIPTVRSPVSPLPPGVVYPSLYIAWFLPLLCWIDGVRARRLIRPLAGLLFTLTAGIVWALGPNQIGPLRWPVRVMPFVTITVLVLFAVLWSQARTARPGWLRLVPTLAWPIAAAGLIVSLFPEDLAMTAVSLLLVLAGLLGVRLASRRVSAGALAILIAGWGVALSVVQHAYYPWPTAVDRQMPTQRSAYAAPLTVAQGDVMLIGDAELVVLPDPRAARELLIASSWYLNPHPVQNVYSTIGFTAYDERYGMRFDGATYPWALDRLFETEPHTDRQRVDLLSISTLLIARRLQDEQRLLHPPPGWHLAAQSAWTVTWVRDTPVPPAGGLVWNSPGSRVTQLSSTTTEVQLKVEGVPADGGQVVLSRLAWPGYSTSAGGLGPLTDGYLLTVDLPESAVGQVVTVRYRPPGWAVERMALALGVGLALLWSAAAAVSRGRPGRRRR